MTGYFTGLRRQTAKEIQMQKNPVLYEDGVSNGLQSALGSDF